MKYLLFFLLSFTTLSWAHDYWLEADKFQVAVGEDLVVHLYVGHNFDAEIERKLQKDMTSKFMLVTKEKSIDLLKEFSEGNFPIVKRKLDLAGPTLLVMDRNFASIELEKDKFVKYLKEEQGEHAKLHNNEGKQRERYARCIKSLVVCGDKTQGDIHKKVFGQKLEIILLQNPYTTSLGGSIEAKILFEGKPLANKMVMAQNKDAEGKINTLKAKTNSEGIAKFTMNHKGVWIVRLVHILPLVDEDYDWESFWASYSFHIKQFGDFMKRLLLLLIFTPILLQAHGVKYEIIKDKGIGLIVKYDTGEPMVDAEVAIYNPKDYKKPYLTMTTDQQGCFMFLPNISGKWAIVVNDNSGHGVQKTIEVDLSTNSTFSIAKDSVTQKIIMALCVIWGLIGTSLFFISKNKNSSLETKK